MRIQNFSLFALFSVLSPFVLQIAAAESQSPRPTLDVPGKTPYVNDLYPGLASACLTFARMADLPTDTVLTAETFRITAKEVADEIAKAPPEMQAQLKKNAFYVLENMVTWKVLLALAGTTAPAIKEDAASPDERASIESYLKRVVANVKVSEEEVAEFYENNKDMCGGATLEQMKDTLKQYVLQQKQQQAVDEHIRTVGLKMPLQISSTWTREQSILAKDNPVDKARGSGAPSLVDFGSTGCRPCDMLAPILETLKEKYAGKLNVVFVHVGQEQILAGRYGVQTIPTQFFYDKNGKEVYRHVGFIPQADIEAKLTEMGVR